MDLANTFHTWQRGQEFLCTEYAIMAGAMSWISDSQFVASVANAKGFGVIACSAMQPDHLDKEIAVTKDILKSNNFGVNIIIMHPKINELIDVCIRHKVSHVIFAGGIPTKAMIDKVKSHRMKTISFTPNLTLAKRLIKNGIDALVIEGMEAGGHIGPTSTAVIAQEVLPNVKDVPVFIAGGIGTGYAIAQYLKMGACGCQIGTLLAASKESKAHENFKRALIRASAKDAISSVQFYPHLPVIPVRALKNQSVEMFNQYQHKIAAQVKNNEISEEDGKLEIEKFWAGALRKAVIDGDVKNGSVMAGQIVSMIKEELPISKIFDNLIQEAEDYIHNRCMEMETTNFSL